jgi:hypothetical protein
VHTGARHLLADSRRNIMILKVEVICSPELLQVHCMNNSCIRPPYDINRFHGTNHVVPYDINRFLGTNPVVVSESKVGIGILQSTYVNCSNKLIQMLRIEDQTKEIYCSVQGHVSSCSAQVTVLRRCLLLVVQSKLSTYMGFIAKS